MPGVTDPHILGLEQWSAPGSGDLSLLVGSPECEQFIEGFVKLRAVSNLAIKRKFQWILYRIQTRSTNQQTLALVSRQAREEIRDASLYSA
jgi:hypothetical protein